MNAPASFRRRSIAVAPKTYADYLAEARARQAGRGIASRFLTVTDEELAQADLRLTSLIDPAAKLAMQDHFFAVHGVRRGDDCRGAVVELKASRALGGL